MTRTLTFFICGLCGLCAPFLIVGCNSGNDQANNETQAEEKMTQISVSLLHQMVESNQKLFLLDVRTEPEFDDTRLSFTDLRISYDSLKDALDQLPEDKAIYIYCFCRSGRRSDIAAEILRQNGYINAINVTGGIIAWGDAGYNVVRGSDQ